MNAKEKKEAKEAEKQAKLEAKEAEVVEEKVKEDPKEEVDLYAGKKLGKLEILKSGPKVINKVSYIEIKLSDETTQVLSERDLDKQTK